MKPVRLGFIGLGHITVKAHLPGLKPFMEKNQVEIAAFCDSDRETAAKQAGSYGIKSIYTDHREMFDKEILDGVYICIPPTLHSDAELIAAKKGIAVFVEKPQTLSMKQAVTFSKAIEKAGVVSQVGFMSRYFETSAYVRELLLSRKPRHVNVQLFYSGRHVRYWTSRFELCGGSFVENTIHTVDLLRYFLGDIQDVSAFYFERKPGEGPEPINMPHVYNVNYRFRSGVVGNVTTSRVLTNVPVSRNNIAIICDDSLIEWSRNQVVENGKVFFESKEGENAFQLQAEAFIAAILDSRLNETPGNVANVIRSPYPESLNSLAAVLGANASAGKAGKVVSLYEFTQG